MKTTTSLYRTLVDLLLADMWQNGADGALHAFLFGRPGAPHFERRLGTEVAFGRKGMVRAALLLRQNGPAYLKYLPIEDVSKLLTEFVCANYWYLADDAFGRSFDESYADVASEAAKAQLANALAASSIFDPPMQLTLYPLVALRIEADFDSASFFLIAAQSLDQDRLPPDTRVRGFVSGHFPPLPDWEGHKERPSAWLGIRSPQVKAAEKIKAIILGALALTPMHKYRHAFSMRHTFGGRCTLGEGSVSTSLGDAHLPATMDDIVLTAPDHAWLSVLAARLEENDRKTRRLLRALQYVYRAWPLDPPERFPVLYMALDAAFGEPGRAADAVIENVHALIGPHVPPARLRLLMDLRAAVVHGGAPDVCDCSKYMDYFDQYETDPIADLGVVLVECLRRKIFGTAWREQPDPHADVYAELKASGRWRERTPKSSILDAPPSGISSPTRS